MPEKSHLTGRLINKFAGQETRASPHLTPFFYTFCSPWAAFSSCLANRLRNLKRDAAIEMDCGVFAFGFGYLENRQLPVASPQSPIQFYTRTRLVASISLFSRELRSLWPAVFLACQWV